MANFYARYPAYNASSLSVQTVQGEGTPGTPVGGLLTVQGDPSGTPIPITGSITATNPSVGPTGSAVPADITYMGMSVAGTATGLTGDSNGVHTVINAALPAGTNLLGKVGIDQTTPGTTNGVQATSGTTVTWQAEGNLAFGSITNAYQTIFTPSANTKMLFMRNNTNAAISVSMDAGTTTNFIFDSGDQLAVDFVANGLISTTTAIQIKYAVGAPTSGSFRVNGAH